MILEELGLPYETSWVEVEDLKKEPYESINPNGRVPGMQAANGLHRLLHLRVSFLETPSRTRQALTCLPLAAIEDPNTGITLWESAAIISYLIDTYDKEHKLDYTSTPEKYLLEQWSYFQASGQGPYFGQCAW